MENNSQNTRSTFVDFCPLQIPAVEDTRSWGGVLTDLRAPPHTGREKSLSLSPGGSWTSAYRRAPFPLLVRVWAEVSPSSLEMCSTQLLHRPSKLIPWSAETTDQTQAFSGHGVLLAPLVGRLIWALIQHPGWQAAPGGSERGSIPTWPVFWGGKGIVCEGTVEHMGFPWRKPHSPSPWEQSMGTGPWRWAALSLATPLPWTLSCQRRSLRFKLCWFLCGLSDVDSTPKFTIWQWFCGSFKKEVLSHKKIIFEL